MSLSGKWCPQCRAEYIEGWGRCDRCGVDLVDRLSPIDVQDEQFVNIWEGPFRQGTVFARLLEQAHIPVEMDDSYEPGRCRVQVPKDYIADAHDVLANAGSAQIEEALRARDEDDELPPPADGLAPWQRLVLALIALVLVFLLFTQRI